MKVSKYKGKEFELNRLNVLKVPYIFLQLVCAYIILEYFITDDLNRKHITKVLIFQFFLARTPGYTIFNSNIYFLKKKNEKTIQDLITLRFDHISHILINYNQY